MKQEKCYHLFGQCFNQGDFSNLSKALREDALYESHDFLYKIRGREKVIATLNERVKAYTKGQVVACGGYYFKEMLTLKRLLPCVILYDIQQKNVVRLITIGLRRGKIIAITGLSPKDYTYTRGDIIEL